MFFSNQESRRAASGLVVMAVVAAAVSELPAGGSGGRRGQGASGSFISAEANGQTFTHTLTFDELAENAVGALVALIDADPSFSSPDPNTVSVPPIFDPNDVVFDVLTEIGGQIATLTVCENDQNFANVGVFFNGGRDQAIINKPTATNGGNYNLRLDMQTTTDVNQNFATGAGNPAALISSITSTLQGLGFTVVDTGTDLAISKAGDVILAVRVETTDASITDLCVGQSDILPVHNVPTLSEYGVILLAIALLTAMMLMSRRMRTAGG